MKKKEFFEFIGSINRYSLLDRMKCDCEYWLGNGHKCNKYLWGSDPDDHIQYMKWLYDSFGENDKPEWLTMADIEEYEKKMHVDLEEYKREYFDIVSKYVDAYGADYLKTESGKRTIYGRAAEDFICRHSEKTFKKIAEDWRAA